MRKITRKSTLILSFFYCIFILCRLCWPNRVGSTIFNIKGKPQTCQTGSGKGSVYYSFTCSLKTQHTFLSREKWQKITSFWAYHQILVTKLIFCQQIWQNFLLKDDKVKQNYSDSTFLRRVEDQGLFFLQCFNLVSNVSKFKRCVSF